MCHLTFKRRVRRQTDRHGRARTDRETDRQTARQIYRWMDGYWRVQTEDTGRYRQTDGQTDRWRDIQNTDGYWWVQTDR